MIINASEGTVVLFIALILYMLAIAWCEITDAIDTWKKRRKRK